MLLKDDEWEIAKKHLNAKKDGTKLSHKTAEFKLTHSYIKIGIIYRLARGKNPDALLGEGAHGRVKLMEDDEGDSVAVKISKEFNRREFTHLMDQGIGIAETWRWDKAKHYTVMEYLGMPLLLKLKEFKVKICALPPRELDPATIYVFPDQTYNKLVFCYVFDIDLKKNHRIKSLYELDAAAFAAQKISKTKFNVLFLSKKPADTDIQKSILYLYPDGDEICCAFYNAQKIQIIRLHPQSKHHNLIQEAIEKEKLREILQNITQQPYPFIIIKESLKGEDEIIENLLYLYAKQDKIYCGYKTANGFVGPVILPDHPDYSILKQAIDREEQAFASIYKTLGLHSAYTLTEEKRLDYAIDMCLKVANLHEGDTKMHRLPLAHLDLKPGNVLVDENDRLHLTDFGLSRQNPRTLVSVSPGGTRKYLPPPAYHNLSYEQYDIIALKRTVCLPQTFYCSSGLSAITNLDYLKANSLLTPEILRKYATSSYITTAYVKGVDALRYIFSFYTSAEFLAAILIIARLNLHKDIPYEQIRQNTALCKWITKVYKQHEAKASGLIFAIYIYYQINPQVQIDYEWLKNNPSFIEMMVLAYKDLKDNAFSDVLKNTIQAIFELYHYKLMPDQELYRRQIQNKPYLCERIVLAHWEMAPSAVQPFIKAILILDRLQFDLEKYYKYLQKNSFLCQQIASTYHDNPSREQIAATITIYVETEDINLFIWTLLNTTQEKTAYLKLENVRNWIDNNRTGLNKEILASVKTVICGIVEPKKYSVSFYSASKSPINLEVKPEHQLRLTAAQLKQLESEAGTNTLMHEIMNKDAVQAVSQGLKNSAGIESVTSERSEPLPNGRGSDSRSHFQLHPRQ